MKEWTWIYSRDAYGKEIFVGKINEEISVTMETLQKDFSVMLERNQGGQPIVYILGKAAKKRKQIA